MSMAYTGGFITVAVASLANGESLLNFMNQVEASEDFISKWLGMVSYAVPCVLLSMHVLPVCRFCLLSLPPFHPSNSPSGPIL